MTVSTSALESLRDLLVEWTIKNVKATSLADIEVAAVAVQRTCGQVVAETALSHAGREETYLGTSVKCTCGGKARFVDYRGRRVATVVGVVRVERAYYRCKACATGQLPWDREQGLDEQLWSPKVKALVAEVCAHLAYGTAVKLLERISGVRLEESSAEGIVLAGWHALASGRGPEDVPLRKCAREGDYPC